LLAVRSSDRGTLRAGWDPERETGAIVAEEGGRTLDPRVDASEAGREVETNCGEEATDGEEANDAVRIDDPDVDVVPGSDEAGSRVGGVKRGGAAVLPAGGIAW
jgi:hypothetical protein